MEKYSSIMHCVHEIFTYSSASGDIRWRISPRKNVTPGQIAGSLNNSGYRFIHYKGVGYNAAKIAWMPCKGTVPDGEIDHINGVRDDNRISNLRQCTRSENCMNRALRSDNKLNIKGVHFCTHRNAYVAQIQVRGKKKFIGRFNSPEEAKSAYDDFAKSLHGDFANYGKFIK